MVIMYLERKTYIYYFTLLLQYLRYYGIYGIYSIYAGEGDRRKKEQI
jgi:hypothetical protein